MDYYIIESMPLLDMDNSGQRKVILLLLDLLELLIDNVCKLDIKVPNKKIACL